MGKPDDFHLTVLQVYTFVTELICSILSFGQKNKNKTINQTKSLTHWTFNIPVQQVTHLCLRLRVRVPPPLQHLLQQVLAFLRRLYGGALGFAHVPQLTGGVRLHGLAAAPLLAGTRHHAALLKVMEEERQLRHQQREASRVPLNPPNILPTDDQQAGGTL